MSLWRKFWHFEWRLTFTRRFICPSLLFGNVSKIGQNPIRSRNICSVVKFHHFLNPSNTICCHVMSASLPPTHLCIVLLYDLYPCSQSKLSLASYSQKWLRYGSQVAWARLPDSARTRDYATLWPSLQTIMYKIIFLRIGVSLWLSWCKRISGCGIYLSSILYFLITFWYIITKALHQGTKVYHLFGGPTGNRLSWGSSLLNLKEYEAVRPSTTMALSSAGLLGRGGDGARMSRGPFFMRDSVARLAVFDIPFFNG